MPTVRSRLLLLLCAATTAAACSRPPANEAPPPVVLVATVKAADSSGMTFTGEIRARHEFDLAFRVSGRLLRRSVDAGASVRPGQVLAELDPSDLRLAEQGALAQLAAARSELATARADHARQTNLLARKFISQAAFDAKENALKNASARFEQAQAQATISGNQAAYGSLHSDFPALVVSTLAEPGQVIAAGQPVLRLARPEEREVAIVIPEQSIASVRQATQWQVRFSALPAVTLRAELRELAPGADPQSRTYAARLRLLEAPASVHLGMSARVEMLSQAEQNPAQQVPLSAVTDAGQGAQVWVVSDGRVQPRLIQIERFTADSALIKSGLQAGEQIVVAGTSRLSANQSVRVQLRRPPNEQR